MSVKGPPWRKGIIILQQLDRRVPKSFPLKKVLERETKWNRKGFRFEHLPVPSMTMILRSPKKGKRTSRKCFRFMDKNPRIKMNISKSSQFSQSSVYVMCQSVLWDGGVASHGCGLFYWKFIDISRLCRMFSRFTRKAPENSPLSKLLSVPPLCIGAVLHQRRNIEKKGSPWLIFLYFPSRWTFSLSPRR